MTSAVASRGEGGKRGRERREGRGEGRGRKGERGRRGEGEMMRMSSAVASRKGKWGG